MAHFSGVIKCILVQSVAVSKCGLNIAIIPSLAGLQFENKTNGWFCDFKFT